MEAGPRVLAAYSEDLSEAARKQLETLGVSVWTGVQVTSIDAEGVCIGDERVHARNVLWAAGVAGSQLAKTMGVPLDRSGRVIVNPDLTIPGRDDVYVIGDLAHLEDDGALVPGVAPAAMQQGQHAARNILAGLEGRTRQPFHYVDKGMLATIGRGAAVARIGRFKTTGFLAWTLWLFVHIFFLIGFRNRLVVLIQWAWSYVTFDRGARLITAPLKEPLVENPGVEPAARE
jgi:NADH dehydrogenase